MVSNIVQVDAIERDSSGRRVEPPRCLDNSVGMQGSGPGTLEQDCISKISSSHLHQKAAGSVFTVNRRGA